MFLSIFVADTKIIFHYDFVAPLTIAIAITTNKTLITDKTLTGEEKKILIYYIQTMKRLPCLICSVNIMFIKTKRGICLSLMVPVQLFLSWRLYQFSMVYYSDLPVTNPIIVILQIMFRNTLLVTGLFDRICSFWKLWCVLLWLLALAQDFVTVLPLYCFPQTLHSIKCTTILELQLNFSLFGKLYLNVYF